MSFLASASKKVTDVREFLRDAAGGNSLKYKPESGQRHYVHIPAIIEPIVGDDGTTIEKKSIVAIAGDVHEWNSPDGKYKASVCLKDVVRTAEDGTVLNDGSCPFCEKVGSAWDIYRYRMELEEKTCGKTGDALQKHLDKIKKTLADERKAKDARTYSYVVFVKYRTDASGNPIFGQDKLPEYDLKVAKLSASRIEKLQQQMENSGDTLAGSELIFEYPKTDDARLLVSQSTTAPVFPQMRFTSKYPGLAEKIAQDVEKFTWEGIEKSFQEWQGMTSMEAEKTVTELFEKWDGYQKELAVNPNAKYMEYVGIGNSESNPAIDAPPVAPPVTQMPSAAPVIGEAAPAAEQAATAVDQKIPDADAVFGGAQAPSINI